MLTQRAPKCVVGEVFQDVRHILDRLAKRFAVKFNCDLEESQAQAYFHFLEAYHEFRPERGTTIQQRVTLLVWNRLLDGIDKDARFADRLKRADADFDFIESRDPEPFDREDFCSGLTDDAKTVVSLLLDTPGELLDMIRQEKPSQENPGAPIRRCLSRYIRCGLGWAASRIASTFAELEEAVA